MMEAKVDDADQQNDIGAQVVRQNSKRVDPKPENDSEEVFNVDDWQGTGHEHVLSEALQGRGEGKGNGGIPLAMPGQNAKRVVSLGDMSLPSALRD